MSRNVSFCVVVLLALSCATTATTRSQTNAAAEGEHVDVDPILADEATGLTAELIRAQSKKRVIDVLANRLQEAGVDVVVHDDALVATLHANTTHANDPHATGTHANGTHATDTHATPSAGALLLFGDAETAPVDDAWTKPPFEGAIEGGSLVGRGALDALSLDALDALTLIALKRSETPLARDVVFAIGALPTTKVAYALSEGGFIVESALRPGEDLAAVDVAEKGVFRFSLAAHSDGEPAAERIVRASARVLAHRSEEAARVTKPVGRELDDIGRAHGGIEAFAPAWFERVDDALVRDTCALTQLSAGARGDAVPATASATFDCRLLPNTEPRAFRDEMLAAVDDPRVDVRVLAAWPASSSDPDSAVVDAIRARVKAEEPGAAVVTALAVDAGACRVVRAAGVACFGFTPIRLTKAERASYRGRDESVRISELERALPRLVDVVAALAR